MERAEYERNLIHSIITSVEEHGGKRSLSSIILTGSFGRGEPTYAARSDGQLQLKSDVEIALVFPESSKKQIVNKLLADVTAEFQEDLNLMAINEKRVRKSYNFNTSLVVPKYKTIFTFDLFNGSKTIWGQDFIGALHITLDEIDVYEAKRLVANRIGELVYLQETAPDNQREYLRKQWKGKLILAIVSAWLICEKKYTSSYHKQYKSIEQNQKSIERILGHSFVQEYQRVFAFLRESGEEYEVNDLELRNYVQRINRYFKNQRVGQPKVNSISRVIKYFLKYLKTNMEYGIVNFEDGILQTLINEYAENQSSVKLTADVWHRVLY